MRGVRIILALATFCVLATNAAAQDLGDSASSQLFLTSAVGQSGSGDFTGALLQPAVTGTASQITFAPAVSQGVGSIPVVGGPLTGTTGAVSEAVWFWDQVWAADRDLVDSVRLDLWLGEQANGIATLTAALFDVGSEGGLRELARGTYSLSSGTLGGAITMNLPVSDARLTEGHALRLHLSVGGVAGATALDYDTQATPSNLILTHTLADSDGDGVSDSVERQLGSNPKDPSDPADARRDHDRDGLADNVETNLGTDPYDADTDGDGYGDGVEFYSGTNPLDADDYPMDTDGDGLPDDYELALGTDPSAIDTDGDGVSDCDSDPDEDGLSNCQELANGTDPLNPDTDGDGALDGAEVNAGTDPLVDPDAIAAEESDPTEPIVGSIFFVLAVALIGAGLFSRHAL